MLITVLYSVSAHMEARFLSPLVPFYLLIMIRGLPSTPKSILIAGLCFNLLVFYIINYSGR